MSAPRPEDHPKNPNEVKVCGLNACLAIFAQRREDVIRVYVNRGKLKPLAEVLSWCAETRRAYHVVNDSDLEKLTKSRHHEGVCLLVRQPGPLKFRFVVDRERQTSGPRCLVLLENVVNPHNLGAIARVAAHFGVQAILLAGEAPTLSAAVHRTAEGALEHVPVVRIGDPVAALVLLRQAGFVGVATSSHAGEPLGAAPLPERTVFLLGAEREGLSPRLLEAAETCVSIPGTGTVESLNVGTATAVLLAEFRRTHAL
ncbi:MAG: rRNA methyltransferase [Victivallales bacterium]|nr:rRNA methyltransferase [Victivallales bacterium]